MRFEKPKAFLRKVFFPILVLSSCCTNNDKLVDKLDVNQIDQSVLRAHTFHQDATNVDKLAGLEHQIVVLTSDSTCSSNQDCTSIGMGARACGGVEKYRIYSKSNTDNSLLVAKVNRYNKLSREMIPPGTMGICDFISPPNTICFEGKCKKSSRL